MLLATALARLKLKTAASSEPTLSDDELTTILGGCQIEDSFGVAPSDLDWAGAWDISLAARQAWQLKAGKVAGNPTYSADGASYQLSDIYTHCMAMAATFGGAGSVSVGGVLS